MSLCWGPCKISGNLALLLYSFTLGIIIMFYLSLFVCARIMDLDMDIAELLKMFYRPEVVDSLTAEQREVAWADIVDLVKLDSSWTFDESLLPPEDNATRPENPDPPSPREPLYEPITPQAEDVAVATSQGWPASQDYVTMLNAYRHTPIPRLPSADSRASQTSLLRPKLPLEPQPSTSKPDPPFSPISIDGHTSQHKFSCVCPCLGYTITVHKIGQGQKCLSD